MKNATANARPTNAQLESLKSLSAFLDERSVKLQEELNVARESKSQRVDDIINANFETLREDVREHCPEMADRLVVARTNDWDDNTRPNIAIGFTRTDRNWDEVVLRIETIGLNDDGTPKGYDYNDKRGNCFRIIDTYERVSPYDPTGETIDQRAIVSKTEYSGTSYSRIEEAELREMTNQVMLVNALTNDLADRVDEFALQTLPFCREILNEDDDNDAKNSRVRADRKLIDRVNNVTRLVLALDEMNYDWASHTKTNLRKAIAKDAEYVNGWTKAEKVDNAIQLLDNVTNLIELAELVA